MARLTAAERSKLPDRAFAYVDSAGARRLPIVDAAHVRNALARFSQVQFEDDQARAEARTRLLRAARKFRKETLGDLPERIFRGPGSAKKKPARKRAAGHKTRARR